MSNAFFRKIQCIHFDKDKEISIFLGYQTLINTETNRRPENQPLMSSTWLTMAEEYIRSSIQQGIKKSTVLGSITTIPFQFTQQRALQSHIEMEITVYRSARLFYGLLLA